MTMGSDSIDRSTPPAPDQAGSRAATLTNAGAQDDKHAVDGTTSGKEQEEDGIQYPHGIKLALIMGSSYLSMFLVALVRSSSPQGP